MKAWERRKQQGGCPLFGCHAFNARPEGCANAQTGNSAGCHAFNARPEGCANAQRRFFAGYHAFNARPEGATRPQPRASDRRERHPGLARVRSDTPPEGAKATTGGSKSADEGVISPTGAFTFAEKSLLSLLLPPPGAYRTALDLTQGVARYACLPWAGSLLPLRGAR